MSSIFAFLLILVPLVVFHELGHFIMCKLGGIKVTKFAFGFGTRLFGFRYKGTDYRWNLIPLGGYVDFMGEVVYTGRIPDDVAHFYNRPKWLRFLVLVMGPLFNIVLALGIYWFYYAVEPYETMVAQGEPFTVGYVVEDSPEARAGLRAGDRIVQFHGKPIERSSDLLDLVVVNPGQKVGMEVLRDGKRLNLEYTVAAHEDDGYGLFHFYENARIMVDRVVEGFAADGVLQPGDLITHVNGVQVFNGTGLNSIQGQIAAKAPGASTFTVIRDGQLLDQPLELQPRQNEDGQWMIGIQLGIETVTVNLGAGEAFGVAWDTFTRDATMIYRILQSAARNISSFFKMVAGPIGIANVAKDTLVNRGLMDFILLMAVLSLNLGIMNLLPIPVLDGGEIFVLLVEWISRKDFSLDTKIRIKLVGVLFLFLLMGAVIVKEVFKYLL